MNSFAVISAKRVSQANRAMKFAAIVTAVCAFFSGARLVQAKMHKADLADRIRLQTRTLDGLQEALKHEPPVVVVAATATDPISKLHTQLERAAAAAGCRVEEFQAQTDRSPFASVFTLDTNLKGWDQVSVHITVRGSLAATASTLDTLAKGDVPIEPDSVEITRQNVSAKGPSDVFLRIDLRVLLRSGGKA